MEQLHIWVELAASLATALATVVLAWFTIVLARQTKRLADVGEQPSVVVTIEPNRHSMMYLDIYAQNTGTATAYDIELTFDPPLRIVERSGRGPNAPLEKISLLKPNQAIKSSLAGWHDLEPKAFTVYTSWKRKPDSEKRQHLSYSIDLTYMERISRLGGDPDIDVAQATKKIADTIQSIGRGHSKLSVNTYNAKDRTLEEEELERIFSEQSAALEERSQSKPTSSPNISEKP